MRKVVIRVQAPFSPERAHAELKSWGLPYRVTQTNYTTIYENARFKRVVSSNYTGFGLMRLIVQVRAEILSRLEKLQLDDIGQPNYYRINRRNFSTGRGQYDCYEVDISSAYLYSAHLLGLISKKTFKRIATISKANRLRVLGSIAMRKLVVQYDASGREQSREWQYNAQLCNAWRHICRRVDMVMSEIADILGNAFLFYWVDGIYFLSTSDAAREIVREIERQGFKSKLSRAKILFIRANNYVYINKNNSGTFAVPLIYE